MPSSFKTFVVAAFLLSTLVLCAANDPTRCRSTTAGKSGLELTGYTRLVSTPVTGCIRPAVVQSDEIYVVRINVTSNFGEIFLNITKGDLFRSDCFYTVILTTAESVKEGNHQRRLKWIVHISDEVQRSQLEIVTTPDSRAVDFLTGEQASNRTIIGDDDDVIQTRSANTITISEMSTIAVQLTIGADIACEDQGEMKEPDVSKMVRGSSLTPAPMSCLSSPPSDGGKNNDALRVKIAAQSCKAKVLTLDLEDLGHGGLAEDQISVIFTILLPKGSRLEVRSDPDRLLRHDFIFKTTRDVTIATHHLHVAGEFSVTNNNTNNTNNNTSINYRTDIAAAAAMANDSDIAIVFPDSVDVMRAQFGMPACEPFLHLNYPVTIIFGFSFVLVIFVIALFSKHIFSWGKSMSNTSVIPERNYIRSSTRMSSFSNTSTRMSSRQRIQSRQLRVGSSQYRHELKPITRTNAQDAAAAKLPRMAAELSSIPDPI